MKNIEYNDYSEYLVEQALLKAGFRVLAKDTYYFNGIACKLRSGPGRPPDLDFIAEIPCQKYVGVEVKNRLEYPKKREICDLINLCACLNLKPLLVARRVHPSVFSIVPRHKGYVCIFRRYILQPELPREKFNEITKELGFPLSVYRYTPDFLVKELKKAKEYLAKN